MKSATMPYSHPDLQRRSRNETIQEISKTNHVIEETIGVKPKWFTPPSGSFNKVTIEVADELNMKTILWTVDTVDWRKPATGAMVKRMITNVYESIFIFRHGLKNGQPAFSANEIIKLLIPTCT